MLPWRSLHHFTSTFRYSVRAIELVWLTSRTLTLGLALITLLTGLLPALIAYIGKLIVDSVVTASQTGASSDQSTALVYVGIEAVILLILTGAQTGQYICQSLLRVLLGQKVNVLILEKALTLDLAHFEDSEFYDKMTRARQEASSRPLSFVMRSFAVVRLVLSLISFGGLLLQFSAWVLLALILASIPVFVSETRFAGEAFQLFRRRAPETRQQVYLETLIAREDFAREVKLYQLGPTMLHRYRAIFEQLYGEGRDLTIRRNLWSFGLEILSSVTFYLAYGWIVIRTIAGQLSLGDMTLYLTIFRQGQANLAALLKNLSDMYEDNLYLSTLYEFLDQEIPSAQGQATQGPHPDDGIRFEYVSFIYPGSETAALQDISFHLKPGEKVALVGKNGSGKTTLINLLTRMYPPSSGRILLDGLNLQYWNPEVLHRRIGIIFQNFVRYQFTVGENIGVGDVDQLEAQDQWHIAAEKGMSNPFIQQLPQQFFTQLGKWFKKGIELSGGQWQKIALSRAFMRTKADILVLDEPTSAMDAEAEFEIFERFRSLTQNQITILISHRFSTVRMADKIIVLEQGQILEQGSHEQLLAADGHYAKLFKLQAAGYQ